jgi:hypothetical protein
LCRDPILAIWFQTIGQKTSIPTNPSLNHRFRHSQYMPLPSVKVLD